MTAAAIPATVAPSAAAVSERSWVWSLGPFMVMCVGMFIALLDIQIVASSLQNIGGGLSAAQDQISWVQTAYLIAEIIMIPLSGWLTRVFSTRWLFTASSVGFTVASMLCGLAWNIESMIVFRALQGMLGASMIPIVFTSTFHYFQGPRRVYSAAVVGAIASVAPTLGPVIGGFITDTLDWRWLFYANVVPGIAISILVPLLVKIDKPDLSLLKGADYPGIILLAMTLGTLEYVLEEGSRWNWFDDATIRDCAMIAAIAGFLFVVRSLTFARPVVDLRALGNRNFTLGCILSFITGIGIFSTIYLTPLFLGYVRGFSAWQTGMAVFSTGMASLVGVPVYVMLAKRFDTRWLMMIGLASFGLSMWSFSFITHEWGAAELFLPQILRGFPQVFAVAPSVNLGLGSLPPERLKYASGLFNMMRNLGGAVGIAVCGAILNNRTNFHFHAIASNLTPANGAMNQARGRGRSALCGDARKPASRTPGGAQAALGAHLPRGLDDGLRRRLSRHHGRLHLRHDAGAFPAQCRPRRRSRRRLRTSSTSLALRRREAASKGASGDAEAAGRLSRFLDPPSRRDARHRSSRMRSVALVARTWALASDRHPRAHRGLVHLLARAGEHDDAAVQHRVVVADVARPFEILLDDEDRHLALAAQMHKRAADVLDDRRLDALGRLVEDKEFGLRHQRAGDGELLLLAARKVAAAASQHVVEHGKERKDLVVDRPLGSRPRRVAGHEIFAHGEQRENLAALRDIAKAGLGPQVGRHLRHVLVVPADRAGRRHVLPHDRAQERRLADAIAAKDGQNAPGLRLDRHGSQRLRRAVEKIDLVDGQHAFTAPDRLRRRAGRRSPGRACPRPAPSPREGTSP